MKRILSSIALAVATLGAAAPAAAAPTLTFTANDTTIGIGESTIVTATLSDLGASVLTTFDLEFIYNSVVLDLKSAVFNSAILPQDPDPIFQLPLIIDDVPGAYRVNGATVVDRATIGAAQAGGTFELFTFTFDGLANGVSTITLGASPDFARNFDDDSNRIDVAVGSICIAVGTGSCDNNVPEPATYGLAGVGLLAAGLAGRRRKAVQAKA